MKAEAHERHKPIHAVFHSQILRRQIRDLGVDFEAVGPGMRTREMTIVMIAGTSNATTATAGIDTVFSLLGKVMLGSCK